MIALRIELLAGRVHATPWDHHVNEGQVEWPPSPWRLARALVAASWRMADRDEAATRALILKLADALPVYHLPPATTGHTRHYMPQYAGSTAKVFDAFVAVSAGGEGTALTVGWPGVRLDADERALLTAIVHHLSALGRAESWATAEVVDDLPGPATAFPADDEGDEAVSLWALQPEADWLAWREGFKARGGQLKDLPPTRWEALQVDTGWLAAGRWSKPPATRTVRYALARPLIVQPTTRAATPARQRPVTLARYALVGRVLPTVARTLVFGERVRRALMACSARGEDGVAHPVFVGREEDAVARGQQHAFFLPCDDDGDGSIDHVLVWARGGFDADAQRALTAMRSIWAEEGAGEDGRYRTVLLATGDPADVAPRRERHAARAALASRCWVSETPFVRFRHTRRRGDGFRDTPEDQVRLALSHIGLPHGPEDVRVWHDRGPEEEAAWARRFIRSRLRGGGSAAGSRGFSFALEFREPQRGPIALGYGAHFGLGLFVPAD